MKHPLVRDLAIRAWSVVKLLGATFLLGVLLGCMWRAFVFGWMLTR